MRENSSLVVSRAAGAWDLFRDLCRLVVIVVCCMQLLVGASCVDLLRVEASAFHAVDRLMRVAWVATRIGTFAGTASIVVVVHEVREGALAGDDAWDSVRDHLQNPYSSSVAVLQLRQR